MSAKKWVVVGGGDKGGIVVRVDKAVSSAQTDDRLATGALVKQVGIAGERLQYKKILGAGPPTGWVSTNLKGKKLLLEVKQPKFEVVIKPRMFCRKEPSAEAAPSGGLNEGKIVEALEFSTDGKFIKVDEGEWAMIEHPEKGQLLKFLAPDPEEGDEPMLSKKSWDVEFKFKGCGANVTGLAGGTGGASRDQLFEFLCLQHLQEDLRKDFPGQMPLFLFDTGAADEAEIVACFQTAGHLIPDEPEPGRKPKPSPGGVRQFVRELGGLRCILVQKEDGPPPSVVVVLAHGVMVLGDDLYGLADYLAKPGLLLVLPQAPHECEIDRPDEEEWKRLPLQWWVPPRRGDPTKELEAAGTQFAQCAKEALDLADSGAQLVLGGFSQGAGVALSAAISKKENLGAPLSGLVLLAAGAPPEPLPTKSLASVSVIVSAGAADTTAPASESEKLQEACAAAGADAELVKHQGGHEVTPVVAKALKAFLEKRMQS